MCFRSFADDVVSLEILCSFKFGGHLNGTAFVIVSLIPSLTAESFMYLCTSSHCEKVTFLLLILENPRSAWAFRVVDLPYRGSACELSNISQVKSSQVKTSHKQQFIAYSNPLPSLLPSTGSLPEEVMSCLHNPYSKVLYKMPTLRCLESFLKNVSLHIHISGVDAKPCVFVLHYLIYTKSSDCSIRSANFEIYKSKPVSLRHFQNYDRLVREKSE